MQSASKKTIATSVTSENDGTIGLFLYGDLGLGGLSSHGYITMADAERLIRRLRDAIDSAPRVADAADLGLHEAA